MKRCDEQHSNVDKRCREQWEHEWFGCPPGECLIVWIANYQAEPSRTWTESDLPY